MLDAALAVLHPFNAKKTNKEVSLSLLHVGRLHKAEAHLRHCFLYKYISFGSLF